MHRYILKFKDEAMERKYIHSAIKEKRNIIFYGAITFEFTAVLIDFGPLKLSLTDTGVVVRFILTVAVFICYYIIYVKDKKFIDKFH